MCTVNLDTRDCMKFSNDLDLTAHPQADSGQCTVHDLVDNAPQS